MQKLEYSVDVKKAILSDKSFIFKMLFLIFLIITLSIYLILQSLNIVHDVSIFKKSNLENFKILSLKRFDDSFSSDFDELDELDLSKIELAQNSVEQKSYMKSLSSKQAIEPKVENEKVTNSQSSLPKNETKKKIFIQVNEVVSIKSLKKRFYQTNSPTYAIMISKRYYEKKRYKESLKWSLIANELDSSNEDSWIMFAKSKVKLNQKKDAIDALSEYLRSYDSQRAESILQELIKRT